MSTSLPPLTSPDTGTDSVPMTSALITRLLLDGLPTMRTATLICIENSCKREDGSISLPKSSIVLQIRGACIQLSLDTTVGQLREFLRNSTPLPPWQKSSKPTVCLLYTSPSP